MIAHIFRSRTTRRNIKYRVVLVDRPGEVRRTLVRLIDELMEGNPKTRAIVYCGRTAEAEALAEEEDYHLYYADVGSIEDKAKRMQGWMDSGGVMAATNALGAGLDIPDVRYVFYLGMPHELRDFAQESGRAGRDGLESQSVIVASRPAGSKRQGQQGQQRGLASVREQERLEEAGVAEYVRGEAGCRRIYLDGVMDGRTDRLGCEEGEAQCDLCQQRNGNSNLDLDTHQHEDKDTASYGEAEQRLIAMDKAAQWQQAFVRSKREEEWQRVKEFKEFLHHIADCCTACYHSLLCVR